MDSGHTLRTVREDREVPAGEPFGVLLRRFRLRAGLTQEQLADRAGISPNAVSSLERGVRRHPYPHTRDALAAALGITTTERAVWDGRIPARGTHPTVLVPPTTMVGRATEVDQLSDLLAGERLVTVTGPGGVGKTRLALEVAARCQARFPDGAVFVALAALREPDDVLPAIAHALGLRELGERHPAEVVAAHLRVRRMLLVLDNLEHLLGAAAEVAALVAIAEKCVFLATSRAPLRITGEHIFAVAGLSPAVAAELFVERAARATGHRQAAEADPDLLRELCARLDHLPLAIEIAAATTRVLSPAQLLRRTTTTLGSIRGTRDAQSRQQTLHSTVRWSCDLLSPASRALLRQLAVFAGGWSITAAAALTGDSDIESLDQHLGLLDNSLIVRSDAPEPRFAILETVRAFAQTELADRGELDQVRDRHAALFAGIVADASPRMWSPGATGALDELDTDYDNLRSALRHLLARQRINELADACYGALLFWVIRGHLRDPHALAAAALSTGGGNATARTQLHLVAGSTLLPRGRNDAAAEHFSAAAAGGADPQIRRWALVWGAHAEVYRDRPDAGAALLDVAATLDAADPAVDHAESCAVIGRAHVAIARGAFGEADALLEEHLPEIESRGAPWPLAVALGIHGRISAVIGDIPRADTLLSRSVVIFGELGDTWGMAHQLIHVADVAVQRGDHAKAACLYGAVDALAEDVGARVFQVWQDLSDRYQAAALEALGVDRFTTLRRQGRTMGTADTVKLACGELSPD